MCFKCHNRSIRRTIFLHSYHTLAAFAAIPVLEYDGNPLLIGETRAITINNAALSRVDPQECRMNPKNNYAPRENGPQGPQQYVRFYVKKRLAVGSQLNPPINPRYHFIATRHPIDKALLVSYDNVNPPIYAPPILRIANQTLLEVPAIVGRANDFYTQLGYIYCEKSKLSRLRVLREWPNGRCGIQNILVQLCLEDTDVNQYLLMQNAVTHSIISDIHIRPIFHPQGPVEPSVANTNAAMYGIVLDNCRRLAAVQRKNVARDTMHYYLEGAYDSAFTGLIAIYHCGQPDNPDYQPEWGYRHIFDLLGNPGQVGSRDLFNAAYDSTSDARLNEVWYLCHL